MKLSQYQEAIIEYFKENPKTNIQINAKAGSGKSSILKLLSDLSTRNSIYLAFNTTVAKEMESKIENPKVRVKTFHALAYSYMIWNLREHCAVPNSNHWLGKPDDVDCTPKLDNLKIYKIIEDIYYGRKLTFDEKIWLQDNYVKLYNSVRLSKSEINEKNIAYLCKEHNLFSFLDYDGDVPTVSQSTEMIKKIDKMSREIFDKEMRIDFTDMLYITYNKITAREWKVPYWGYYKDIFCDECQDFSNLQLAFLQLIKTNGGRYVFVGDEKQACYGFADANTQSFNLISKMFAPMEKFDLPVCYRCPVSHLEKVVREFGIKIIARPEAPQGKIYEIKKEDIRKHIKVGDMIISRKNKWLTSVIIDLASHDIPIFMQDKEMVENLVKLIKKAKANSAQELYSSLINVRKEYNKKLLEYATKLAEMTSNALVQTGEADGEVITSDLPNQVMLNADTNKGDMYDFVITILENYLKKHKSASKDDFIEYIKKVLNTTSMKDCVRITSVHKAKGLEANNVFILNNGKVCTNRFASPEQNSQEYNLSYISFTRAKATMYLVEEPDTEDAESNQEKF